MLSAALATATCFSQDRPRVIDVFSENINDSISVDVKLSFDEAGLPEHYFCHVKTPVCEEGLCKLMEIDVYWDVLGNFLEYELPPNEPLTKFDHRPFTADDHARLRTILANRASILRDYPVEHLVDNTVVRKSEVADAVSAATRVEVKNEIVSGAVYSTYVLWHIVNGPIAQRIEEHSRPMISDALIMKMIRSRNVHYQYYALNHFPAGDSLRYLPEVINLVVSGIDYVPYFAVEAVPAWAWGDERHQYALVQHFADVKFELQNAFLDKLRDVDVSARSLAVLVSALEGVTDEQRLKVLRIADRNKARLSEAAIGTIRRFSRHGDGEVSALATRLVDDAKTRR